MPEVEDYRIKIEAIKEHLKRSSGEGEDEVRALKERLGTVRDSLRRKQEIIDSQKSEIAALHEEKAQLSDMLGQALAAFEAQSQGGIKEIVQSIDSEFADLLADEEAPPEQADSQGDSSPETPSADSKWEPENETPPALQRILGRRKH